MPGSRAGGNLSVWNLRHRGPWLSRGGRHGPHSGPALGPLGAGTADAEEADAGGRLGYGRGPSQGCWGTQHLGCASESFRGLSAGEGEKELGDAEQRLRAPFVERMTAYVGDSGTQTWRLSGEMGTLEQPERHVK